MKTLNIFWVGVGLLVLSGISAQIGWTSLAEGFGTGAVITILASIFISGKNG